MKVSSIKWVSILFSVSLLLLPSFASAEYYFEVVPSISVSGVYNDNIFLDPVNEESDYFTAISPSISLIRRAEHSDIELRYAPTLVWYDEFDENNTTRHAGTITFGQELGKYLKFDLTNTYIRSEEPIEVTEGIEGVRRTRNTYDRNVGQTSLSYLFGPENSLSLGYGLSYLENEDLTLDDGVIQTPFANLAYWFNVKNGVELNYQYTKADFSREVGAAEDDYKGHTGGIRYIHRFTPHTRGYIGYNFNGRNFEGTTEDYKVHEGSIGFEHAFAPDLSISLGGGVFTQDNETSDDETGFTYNASLVKLFERGRFTIGGQGGWDESYLEAERRGFTRYYSGNTRWEYQIAEGFGFYAGGSYRKDRRDLDKREWEVWRGSGGLRWNFWRWFYLSLDYSYAERDDDVDTEDFKVNQIMVTFSASKLYRW